MPFLHCFVDTTAVDNVVVVVVVVSSHATTTRSRVRSTCCDVVEHGCKADCQHNAHDVDTEFVTASSYLFEGFLHPRVDIRDTVVHTVDLVAVKKESMKMG